MSTIEYRLGIEPSCCVFEYYTDMFTQQSTITHQRYCDLTANPWGRYYGLWPGIDTRGPLTNMN